jgi:hypothetical protein
LDQTDPPLLPPPPPEQADHGARWIIAALLAAGAAVRLAWTIRGRLTPTPSEMFNISRAFATTGRLADAYAPGSGLTAHGLPGMPLAAGSVYRLLGVGTPAAELTLSLIALLLVGAALIVLDDAFRRLGAPRLARLCAIAVVALAPLNIASEMVEFRVWEGAVTTLALAVMLRAALALDAAKARPSWTALAAFAAGAALMGMVSQPAALIGFGLLGLLALRRRGIGALVAMAVASAVLLAAVSLPWALRNQAALGERVWGRSSVGFNLAIGFNDRALDTAHPKAEYLKRLDEVDPYQSAYALQQLKAAGGEVAYDRLWKARTYAWIGRRPVDAVRLIIRHLAQFYFPPRWFWTVYSDRGGGGVAIKQALVWGLSLLGLAGLGVELVRRNWRYLYVAAALALATAPYLLAQPMLRYRYPTYAVLLFLTAGLVCRIIAIAREPRPRPAPAEAP